MGIVERLWFGNGVIERAARTALAPASWAYAGATAMRNAMFDRGLLRVHASALPALSLGNLSVGGTGKTPVAAWAAGQLSARGARPAIILRGYGADEPLVHARLNPALPVLVDADRVRAAIAAAERGADCIVLDDAFQHRRIARAADWVLVAAEQWTSDDRRLPAGPLREGRTALARATLLVVTRKTATLDDATAIGHDLASHVPHQALAIMHLAPDRLVHAFDGADAPVASVAGRRFLAVAAVGAPGSFFAQLRTLGASLDGAPFRDHHRFTAAEVRTLQARAQGTDGVVCTLKDAVKLLPLWRGADTPLWYVSQAAAVDRGAHHLEASLAVVLSARQLST